ncbi:MAG: hypothetical protein K8S21_00720 [Gemmatimonadetes bacterium]|nr:hypothetical protein [Gemmatimonadota bacterium]
MRKLSWFVLALVLAAPAAGAQGTPAAGAKVEIPTPEFPTDSLGRIIFKREVYTYPGDGRRDPFASLIATGDIRPLLEDLILTGVIVGATPSQSMVMMKDNSTKEIYRARVGSVFGRIRVTAIRQGEVTLAVDEFGFTRQSVLTFNVPSGGRTP